MRILVLSDLHREIWGEMPVGIDLVTSDPDVVVLAGDIDADVAAVQWAEQAFPGIPTLYVSGNHESYCAHLDTVERRIAKACAASSTVDYLQQVERVIGGVRFLGCTLWTDFALFGHDRRDEAMAEALGSITDFRLIRLAGEGGRTLRPSDTASRHDSDYFWLLSRLSVPFDGPTVVVTHMAPSLASVAPRYRDDILSSAFASQLDELASMTDVWIHGHMHESSDYRIGRCRVVCNPRGYPRRNGQPENARFDPSFVVELVGSPS